MSSPSFRNAATIIFLLGIAVLPVERPTVLMLSGVKIVLPDLVFGLAFLLLLAAVLGQQIPRFTSIHRAMVVYFASMIPSAVAGGATRNVLKLFLEAAYLGIAVVSAEIARVPGMLRRALRVWLGAAAAISLLGVLGVCFFYAGIREESINFVVEPGFGSLPPGNYPRLGVLFRETNPNSLCNYLSVSFILLLGLIEMKWVSRRFALAAGIVIGAATVFTFSPGLGGLALGVGWWAWSSADVRKRLRPLLLGCGALLAFGFVLAILISPVDTGSHGLTLPVSGTHVVPSSRVLCWEGYWRYFLQRPWVGQGVGIQLPCPEYYSASGGVQVLGDAHSLYLSVLASKGIVGAAGFAVLVVAIFSSRAKASRETAIMRSMKIALAQALLYQGLSGSFEHMRSLWVLIGLIASQCYPVDQVLQHDGAE